MVEEVLRYVTLVKGNCSVEILRNTQIQLPAFKDLLSFAFKMQKYKHQNVLKVTKVKVFIMQTSLFQNNVLYSWILGIDALICETFQFCSG